MSGETDLERLLKSMDATLAPDIFVFATLPKDHHLTAEVTPIMRFIEAEGETLVLTRDEAETAKISFEYPCRMITLNIHSSLEAVGFLAKITNALAAKGISVNPVSAFHHDHLFVPHDRVEDTMETLRHLSSQG